VTPPIDPIIVYFAADLLWGTRIKAEAAAIGVAARPVRTTDMLAARLADSRVVAMLVDLDAPDTAIELIRHARAHEAATPNAASASRIRILAFGPHVEVERFAQARAAGADIVMARGGLARSLGRVLLDLARSPAADSTLTGDLTQE
jgi:hypothetical protein